MSIAIIAPIRTFKHPNADRLQLGNVLGYQVVIGLDVQDGDVGIFFPEGVQLSEEYAKANDLVRRKDADGKAAGGFFEDTRRVRCQKFRGQRSEGYWAPLTSLTFTGYAGIPQAGEQLEELNGVPLCNKYITPATRNARNGQSGHRRETLMFRAHKDTDQFQYNIGSIESRDLLVFTLKMHGTSQRTGHVLDPVELPWWKRFVNGVFKAAVYPTKAWTYLVGTRNVILKMQLGLDCSNGGAHDWHFRQRAAEMFAGKLHKGETVYYEVVGYEKLGVPIMSRHLADGEIKAQYGREITYHYGCGEGECAVYVYRITMTNEDGITIELPWRQVKNRCSELGIRHVPELTEPFHYCGDPEKLRALAQQLANVADPVGLTHPCEGVCIRVEGNQRTRIFKHKSFTFGVLEGYIKDDANYVDAEESA